MQLLKELKGFFVFNFIFFFFDLISFFFYSIPMSAAFTEINLDTFLRSFRRFYAVSPSSEIDMVMYVVVLKFMGRFIDFGM